jgi:hypothetical protein
MIWNDETINIYRTEISEYPYPINNDEDELCYNVSFNLTMLKIAKLSKDRKSAKNYRAKLRRLGYNVSLSDKD